MKKFLLLLVMLCITAALLPVAASATTVTVTDASGFCNGLDTVVDGDTIIVEGTIVLPADFQWHPHKKTVIISGGTLDFSALKDVMLGNGVTFENIKLEFAAGSSLYANGNPLLIKKTVTVSGEPTVYGGGKYTTVDSTDVTLQAGTYTDIFGGGNIGNVSGDVSLSVGGRVNADLKNLSHKHTYSVYGGCNNGKINGKVKLSFSGAARANYIYGGALGSNSSIEGGIEVIFSGGMATSLCGGSRDAFHKCDVKLTMTGGSVEQVFGGSEHAALSGNIELNILDGTVTRRIYGGCYNEVSAGGVWESANYVFGDICLTIGSGANINFTTGSADRAIYAHSRQKTLSDKENTQIRFVDEKACEMYIDKLCAQDGLMQSIMSGVSAADVIHTPGGNTVTVDTKPPLLPIVLLIAAVLIVSILVCLLLRRKR